jgi:template-activating factor I
LPVCLCVLCLLRSVLQLGVHIAHDVFPEAIEYFLGEKSGVEIDSEDEDDEDDEDENEEEIDLEKPRVKKRKM